MPQDFNDGDEENDSDNDVEEEIIDDIEPEVVINEDVRTRGRTRGSMFNASSSFMTGKFIRLKTISALENPCLCCLCRIEMDRENGHNVSIALEKKMFKNGLVAQLGDGMGISFVREGNVDLWQMVCLDCGYIDDNGEVDVVQEVYTLRFHRNYGNIEINSENIFDAFAFAPKLGLDVCRSIRDEFDALERMSLIERRYIKMNEDVRTFEFTDEFQR